MVSIVTPYLGKPGIMRALPQPRDEADATPSRGDVVHELLSGGVAVTRLPRSKRSYALPYPNLSTSEATVLWNYYRGVYGGGPWLYVDPTQRNVLPLDMSTCGIRTSTVAGWGVDSGTVAYDASTVSPVDGSGVLAWSGMGSGASLALSKTVSGIAVDTTSAPVYLPGEAATFSLWVKASAAHTPRLFLNGMSPTTGTRAQFGPQTNISVTTSWQRFTLSVTPGAYGFTGSSVLLAPYLSVASTGMPATVWVAGAQLEYASTAGAFDPGASSPRVVITSTPGKAVSLLGTASSTFNLREV